MGKHTEGPWIEYMGHQVSGSLGDCVMFATDRGELIFSTDANRDLVLAAPDLLEALEKALAYVEKHTFGGTDGIALIAECREVLARAKGESE